MINFTIKLLGIEFDNINMTQAMSAIVRRFENAPFAYVVTPNADHLVRLARNSGLYQPLYDGALLRLLDSRAVDRLARLAGLDVPPVVTGSDLTAALVRHAVAWNESVTIIGLTDEAAGELALRTGLKFKHYNPPVSFEYDHLEFVRVLEFVENNPAKFVFLAAGSPRQEMVAKFLTERGKAKGLGLCIGASLDFLAGTERRAPAWLQAAGMEWAWRLAQNPRRLWRRYLGDLEIVPLLWREARARRLANVQRKKLN